MCPTIRVIQSDNPFAIQTNHVAFDVNAGLNVWEVFHTIGMREFKSKLTVTLDNRELPEDEWDNPIKAGAVVGIMPKVEGSIIAIIIVAVIAIAAIAIALTLTVPVPNTPKISEPDPVYSLKGQTNQIKLGNPIEAPYGQVRHWPAYGAKPYNKYINNEAFQYSLFCLGHGSYDVSQVYIEDTPIEDFQDIEYEITEPNGSVTLFRDNVQTSTEVGSNELFGPNEDEFDDWFVAVANDSGTTTNLIELDVTFPNGLYGQNKKGKLYKVLVTAQFQYIEIDNAGNEIGSWATLLNFSKNLATTTPQRFTISQAVPFGRYKVRGKRTNNASDSFKVGDTLHWESLRSFLPNIGAYGDVTMLAVKARASANLNDQSKRKINCAMTRKLPVYNGASWSAPTATRSVVWAFCDIFRALYGAKLSDTVLDLTSLVALDTLLASEGVYFDWVFDSKTTIWEAAKVVCRAARGVPILDGSQIYIVRDLPKSQVFHLFNDENIVEGSFELGVSLYKNEEYDSLDVEYRDPITWKTETVLCALPDSYGERPESIKVPGITDRNRAFHEGMYILGVRNFQRQEVKFSTGVEGFLATYGDLIKVDYDTFGIDESIGGHVLAVSADRLTLSLSVPVSFTGGFDYRLSVKGKDGTIYGPYTATAGGNEYEVALDAAVTSEINFANHSEPAIFIFGRSISFAQDCVITGLNPGGDDTVEVTAIVYQPEVYAYDNIDAPDIEDPSSTIPDIALPTVTNVTVTPVSGDIYKISWAGVASAQYYVLQMSTNGTDWDTLGQTTATSFESPILFDGDFTVRVAGVNVGQGPWVTATGRTSDFLINPNGDFLTDTDGNLLTN